MNIRRAPTRRTLVIMVKAPTAGRVKTRLTRGIGICAATGFYRHTLANLAARLSNARRWTLVLAVTPDTSLHTSALPGSRATRVPQGRGDLGQRMQRVIDHAPRGPVIIIGSDVPNITARDIAEAFRCLAGHDAVIGPSPDGGYWLVGLNRHPRRIQPFRNVRWSTDEARAGTLANLRGRRVACVAEKADIDERDGWIAAAATRGRRIIAPT